MKKWLCLKLFVVAALLIGAQGAKADISITLGGQDFADGATPTTGAFLAAGAGEPAPFDGVFIGSDVTGPNFSTSWTFLYAAQSNVIGGSMTLGIYDHESSASGNQVASFTLNGIDLTTSLNALFESYGGGSREDNVYTLTLPGSTFTDLGTGNVTFALTLQAPGLGILGETVFNGAALDFSTLDVTAEGTSTVPEPSTMLLLGSGLIGLWGARKKFKKIS
jgi:hypothetical protein